jgi:hypothetical protein
MAAYLLSGKARILGGGNTKTAIVPLETIVPASVRDGSDRLLDHLSFRLFNYPLQTKDRATYLTYLGKHAAPYSNDTVRDLMQIMMSTPDYQLT